MKRPHYYIRTLRDLGKPERDDVRVAYDYKDDIFWIRAPHLYGIEAHRISDARDILTWVRHLSRKPWANRSFIGEFIDVVAQVKGINTRLQE
jgi:hypothetical protein